MIASVTMVFVVSGAGESRRHPARLIARVVYST